MSTEKNSRSPIDDVWADKIVLQEKKLPPSVKTFGSPQFSYQPRKLLPDGEYTKTGLELLGDYGLMGGAKTSYMNRLGQMANDLSGKRTEKRQEIANILLMSDDVVATIANIDLGCACGNSLYLFIKAPQELTACLKYSGPCVSCVPCVVSASPQEEKAA